MSSSDHFEIVWNNLRYVVSAGRSVRPVLKGVSGRIRSRDMVAVMGPSGAGKSTLLECVIGKRVTGNCGCDPATMTTKSCR